MPTIVELGGERAEYSREKSEWVSETQTFAEFLNALIPAEGMPVSDPDPGLTLALQLEEDFDAVIIETEEVRFREEVIY